VLFVVWGKALEVEDSTEVIQFVLDCLGHEALTFDFNDVALEGNPLHKGKGMTNTGIG
jgi:hypothetical protein